MYDSSKIENFERVTLFWIPELKKVTKVPRDETLKIQIIPIIVVATKCDLLKSMEPIKEHQKFLAKEFPVDLR